MSCNCKCNCNCGESNTVVITPSKKTTKIPIHQLKDDGENIYPNTIIKAIHDSRTGESLEIVLSKTNHLYIPFKGNFADTVEEIPEEYRHEGLVITYTDCKGKTKHKVYKGISKNNYSFTDSANWEDFIKTEESSYTDKAPSNLRYEGTTLKLDIVNKEGVVIETLSADLSTLITNRLGFKTQISPSVPTLSNAEPGIIYIVPNPSVPGTAREYILVESPLGKYIEQLGSASGVCSILNDKLDNSNSDINKDNRLLRGELQGNSIVLTVGNNTTEQEIVIDLSSIIPQVPESIDLTPITDRLSALEAKPDKDTLYNDSEVKAEINTLKNKVQTLEGKGDNDTIYNDSELRGRIEALEGRPVGDNSTYDDREIKERITALETKQDKDTVYDDTELSNRVQALESKTDANTYPTNLEILDTETPTTKKIKITLNEGKPALEANINIPQSSTSTNNESFIVFITQQDYDTKLAQNSLDVNKLYVIIPHVE